MRPGRQPAGLIPAGGASPTQWLIRPTALAKDSFQLGGEADKKAAPGWERGAEERRRASSGL